MVSQVSPNTDVRTKPITILLPNCKVWVLFLRDCIAFPPHWGTFLKEECFPNPGFLQKKGGSDPCQDILVNLTFKFIVPLKVMICPQK